ncbi:hypothetical protein UO65_3459 [Actinokineospora spheciospongiae]|uniref:DUF2332 domain-containing protein n=1 Tax=Actinokineospora spheciospongiae TaxID=909613 RepID=W7ILG9_9PSEU|nr:DUF2332 domain-containing protein [Actinokineospora spheciospongiae]EWC61193.1 hypothetical protein UO65_3459 [Actinokineospora spheciospongiae]
MTDPLDDIRTRLRRFARHEAAGESPLYEHLATRAADDPDVAALLTAATGPHPHPTLLLAAAHRALQAEPFHELVNYYPSLGGSYGLDAGTWPLWRSFVLDRADKVRALVAGHTTQTNEVRRAALLYPAVALAAKRAKAPLGLLEVGCSGGLLLNLDRYAYRYQTATAGQIAAGPPKAALGLHCALELAPGATMPVIPKKIAVAARVGLDRAPVDLADEDAAAWLEACIWADQPERRRLFSTAAAVQHKNPPEFVTGDAVADLATAAARIPEDTPLVVLTSHVLTHLPAADRTAFVDALARLAATRPLWWISQEPYAAGLAEVLPDRDDLVPAPDTPAFGVLGLTTWEAGRPNAVALARTAMHGERMTWLA